MEKRKADEYINRGIPVKCKRRSRRMKKQSKKSAEMKAFKLKHIRSESILFFWRWKVWPWGGGGRWGECREKRTEGPTRSCEKFWANFSGAGLLTFLFGFEFSGFEWKWTYGKPEKRANALRQESKKKFIAATTLVGHPPFWPEFVSSLKVARSVRELLRLKSRVKV